MTRTKSWERFSVAHATFDTYGTEKMFTIGAGETIVRTIMGWNANVVLASSAGSPSSAMITKVGLIAVFAGTPLPSIPTPISQPNADWFNLATVPWVSYIAESTNIVWSCNAHMPAEGINSQAKRTVPAATSWDVYICWESLFAIDTLATFVYAPTMTVDTLLEAP